MSSISFPISFSLYIHPCNVCYWVASRPSGHSQGRLGPLYLSAFLFQIWGVAEGSIAEILVLVVEY